MPRHSLNQHKAQVFQASREIERQAAKIAEERVISMHDAIAAVFADPVLLAACHASAPSMGTLPIDWTDPRNEPQQ